MRKHFYLVAVAFVAFATLPVSGQISVEEFRKGFDAITKSLPKLLEEECKKFMENPPPRTIPVSDLASNAEIMRLLSEKEAKISVTFKCRYGRMSYLIEGQFDMYLRYFDGSWTVSRWDATWSRENPPADWGIPVDYFAHRVVLCVDKITEK